MTLDEVIARVPGWAAARAVAAEPLAGGITNENHRVLVDGDAFVVRLGGRRADLLGIDRACEWAAVQTAARLGVGPEVVFGVPEEAVLVTRFVAGAEITPDDLRRPDLITRVAATLRRIHAAPPIPGTFSPFRTVEAYRAVATRYGVALPPGLPARLAFARRIEAALAPALLVLCHNDLLAANLIDQGDRIRVLDWEYAAMGDPFFDLGNLAANADLPAAAEAWLLAAYFGGAEGGPPADAPRRLALMRLASDLREAMWGLVQLGLSRLPFDFAGYAARHFARFDARAGAAPL